MQNYDNFEDLKSQYQENKRYWELEHKLGFKNNKIIKRASESLKKDDIKKLKDLKLFKRGNLD